MFRIFRQRKLIILSLILLVAVAVPLTIYQTQQQQETRQRASGGFSLESTAGNNTKYSTKKFESGLILKNTTPKDITIVDAIITYPDFLKNHISFDFNTSNGLALTAKTEGTSPNYIGYIGANINQTPIIGNINLGKVVIDSSGLSDDELSKMAGSNGVKAIVRYATSDQGKNQNSQEYSILSAADMSSFASDLENFARQAKEMGTTPNTDLTTDNPTVTPTQRTSTPTVAPGDSTNNNSQTNDPTPTLRPTSAPVIGGTQLVLSIKLDGITNASIKKRSGNVYIRPVGANNIVATGTITYDRDSIFKGSINLPASFTPGYYTISSDNTLRKLIGFISPSATPINLPQIALNLGDIAGQTAPGHEPDNIINILDYNVIKDCFGSKSNSNQCKTHPTRASADLNGDNVISGIDFNIFITNIGKREGD